VRERWSRRRIGEVVKVQNGFAFDSAEFSPEGRMPLIRIRDLKRGTKTETGFSGEFDPRFVVKPSDFLIGMDGVCLL
jgi:type I restriction enzyme, S subunit